MRNLAPSLPIADYNTALETMEIHDLTTAQQMAAWEEIEQAWKNTSGRFYAYNVTHQICANIKNTVSALGQKWR